MINFNDLHQFIPDMYKQQVVPQVVPQVVKVKILASSYPIALQHKQRIANHYGINIKDVMYLRHTTTPNFCRHTVYIQIDDASKYSTEVQSRVTPLS